MLNSINVDIGGTFTDCFIVYQGRTAEGKAPTTRYNLSVGFMRAIQDALKKLGLPLRDALQETQIVRYCTTIATNTLIERKGPKLGLITTAGQEDAIFIGRGRQWCDGSTFEEKRNLARVQKPQPLVSREMVVGIKERVDCKGQVIIPLSREEILEKVQYLVDQGSRGFVVSLLWSFLNPAHERMIKAIIEEEFPPSYLGNMPIILSSDLIPKHGEYYRSITTILNAYMHTELAEELRGLGEQLQDYGYPRALTIVDNSGGSASVIKMPAIRTYNSGPVAGVMGAPLLARTYGLDKVILTDMGGTSFDIALLLQGRPQFYEFRPVIERWRVLISPLEVKAIGAGGGSIAWVDPLGRLRVGPQSAGAMPGPACYDMGGTEATVTDADLVLGYLAPDAFLGGRQALNLKKAQEAIRTRIAQPLGMDPVEAAASIRKIVDHTMANEMFKELSVRGLDSREFSCFSYGGAGPSHAVGYCTPLGIRRIFAFSYSPVFCAFGAATIDYSSVFEMATHLTLQLPFERGYLSDYEAFNRIVRDLQAQAWRDLAAQGAPREEILWVLELEMRYGTQLSTLRISSPRLLLETEQDVKEVCQAFTTLYAANYSATSAYPQGGIEIEGLALKATWPLPKFELPVVPPVGADSSPAYTGKRPVWGGDAFH
ncbi:MAG: hydantoinase/oxoprolinase family protein, partial [Candidatus Tectomicrobia bacterium]|nr:hydantoinase/oxoprolinase family protein [Candidatus Tectomicrobia bacterium]